MANDEAFAVVFDLAYLAACAADERIPDARRVGKMDLPALYQTAKRHVLAGIVAMALESAGVKDEVFTQAKGKAVRRAAAFDLERAAVLEKLEEAGIWYMPLKGCVLKDLYPRIGMREMADNDILIDGGRAQDVRTVMESLGFVYIHSGAAHDTYHKEPVCSFEMHRTLFYPGLGKRFSAYYGDVGNRLVKDPGSACGHHFTDEDFYVYMTAHEYKHYAGGGTGLRSLLDVYVYRRKKDETLDGAYIAKELDKLGIADFEARNRSLAMHLFGGEALSGADREMLEYMLSSGAYGTIRNRVSQYGNGPIGKLRYVLKRIFLPYSVVKAVFPRFAANPILLPFLPIYRALRAFSARRDRMKAELRALAKNGSKRK